MNQVSRPNLPIEESYPCTEEDEINLIDLLLVLVKHKHLIAIMVFIAGLGAVLISLSMTNIYRSEATITPREEEKGSSIALPSLGGIGGILAGQLGLGGGGSLEKLEVILRSRNLTLRIIKKYNLMPIIFADNWDKDKKKWNTDEPPTLQDGLKSIKDLLKIKVDVKQKNIKIGIENKDPKIARQIVEYYLKEASEVLREEVIRDATENMRFFKKQINKTNDALLKEKIYTLLAKEIEKETFAQAQKYYGFQIVDPPIVPDLDKKVKPKRRLICILSVLVTFFMAVFLSFFIEFIQRIKAEDPTRYQEMAEGLTIWKAKRK